ncbi:MAG: ARMT1-like domain-containing protein [Deltaproteobacteria bacterium]|nr:ARMT1-like domain-containing protein [Deltaproteobacteria bacterium]
MLTQIECLPCLLNQIVKTITMLGVDNKIRKASMKKSIQLMGKTDLDKSPPEISGLLQNQLCRELEIDDPYLEIKETYNQLLLQKEKQFRNLIQTADSPLETALKLAVGANIIDFGTPYACTEELVEATLENALDLNLNGSKLGKVANTIENAEKILYIGDNAGEIVIDKLLIETIDPAKIIFCVRGGNILNDITRKDAVTCGIDKICPIIDTNSRIPGVALNLTSPEFKNHFETADLIIAKGQGNFETLSQVTKPILYLLKAKCKAVSELLEVPLKTPICKLVNC